MEGAQGCLPARLTANWLEAHTLVRRHVRCLPKLLIRPAVTSGNTLVVSALLLPEVASGTAVERVPSRVDSYQNSDPERPVQRHQHMESRQQGQPHSQTVASH